MSDYDVLNKAFKPELAEGYEVDSTLQINAGSPAYIFYATQDHCANAIKKFLIEPLFENSKMIEEANVLEVLGGLYSILPNLHHAKSTPELPRSAAMKNIASPEE